MQDITSTKKLELIYLSLTGKIIFPEHILTEKTLNESPIVFMSNSHFKNHKNRYEIYVLDLKLMPHYSISSIKEYEKNIPVLSPYFEKDESKSPNDFFAHRFETFMTKILPNLKNVELTVTEENFKTNLNWLVESQVFDEKYANNLIKMLNFAKHRVEENSLEFLLTK